MNLAQFITKSEGKKLVTEGNPSIVAYDASSYGNIELSPFNFNPEFNIPVPGQPDLYSNSVEAIWQGLKMVDGKTDFEMFNKKPKKRPSKKEKKDPDYKYEDSTFLLEDELVDLITARKKIYVPAYKFMFDNYVSKEFKDQVSSQLEEGLQVYFFDVDDNEDIENPHDSFSHASLLTKLMNQYCSTIRFDLKEILEKDPLELERFYATTLKPGEEHSTLGSYIGVIGELFDIVLLKSKHLKNKGCASGGHCVTRTYHFDNGSGVVEHSDFNKGIENYTVELKKEVPKEVRDSLMELKSILDTITTKDYEEREYDSLHSIFNDTSVQYKSKDCKFRFSQKDTGKTAYSFDFSNCITDAKLLKVEENY